jgi:seryl-tRNA synthetase
MREKKFEEAEQVKQDVTKIGNRLDLLEDERKVLQGQEDGLLLIFPNLLDERVPNGTDEEDNELVEQWGEPKQFAFEPKEHHILGEELGLYDAERAAKIAGSRFSILKGDLAKMERALIQLFLDTAEDNGYTEVLVPYIVNRDTMTGTGQLPKFEEDLFKLTSEINGMDGFLIPTAEVPVTNMFRDEIINEEDLPIHLCAFTPCFRAEAGTYGKDTHGLIRQHQFHKVELVKITKPEHSDAEHQALTAHACGILEALELPYRKMRLCAGDTSFAAQMCFDLEVWLPGQGKYREISSCSNFGEFQARRMRTRFRPKGGKPQLCHTINGSGLAVGRTLVAIMENYQQADGSIAIPTVLQPYMRGKTKITLEE